MATQTDAPFLESPTRSRLAETPALKSITVVTVDAAKRTVTFWQRNRAVVAFALLLIALDIAIGLFAPVWQRHSPDDYALRVEGCAKEPRDLVFIGGSPVAEGIDPERIRGAVWHGQPLNSVYAMGLSGGTTSDFYHAVLRGCPRPPRVLVYGMTASDINDSRHEPHGPYSLMTLGDVARWVKLRPEAGEWVIRHYATAKFGQVSSLFRYRHGMRMWAACEADKRLPGSCPETMSEADELRERSDRLQHGNGYAPARGFASGNYAAVYAAGLAPTQFPYLAKYRTGSHLKYLHRLIDWCEARGVQLVLIDMPVTANLEAMHAKEFVEYHTRLAEIERSRGIPVIRARRDAVGLSDAHFADLIHMNLDGAKRFSDWLANRLRVRDGKE